MNELVPKVEQWFIDKGLDKGRPEMQVLKFIEEFSELIVAVANTHEDQVIDALGDMQVVSIGLHLQTDNKIKDYHNADTSFHFLNLVSSMVVNVGKLSEGVAKGRERDIKGALFNIEFYITHLHKTLGYNRLDTLKVAYNEIKDRKGKVVNDNFIKEGDYIE